MEATRPKFYEVLLLTHIMCTSKLHSPRYFPLSRQGTLPAEQLDTTPASKPCTHLGSRDLALLWDEFHKSFVFFFVLIMNPRITAELEISDYFLTLGLVLAVLYALSWVIFLHAQVDLSLQDAL